MVDTDFERKPLGKARLAAFQVFEEAVDLVVTLESDQAIVYGFGFEQGVGYVGGFALFDAGTQTVESSCGLVGGVEGTRCVGFADGASPAVAGDEHVAGGARFLEFVLKLGEGAAQGFGFGGLVVELLGEALR
jgi:hypothetical protein